MEAKSHNGWTNYETWVTALWLDNEQSSYRLLRGLTRAVWREAPHSRAVREWGWSRRDAAVCQLAELIRDFIEERNPVTAATLYADLMNAALCEVNWPEIARHYVEELASEQTERKPTQEGKPYEPHREGEGSK